MSGGKAAGGNSCRFAFLANRSFGRNGFDNQRRTTVPLESDIDLPNPIVADPQRLGQLLSNLLGNAVTHGDRSQPIQVRGFERSGELFLSVNNRGAPIPDAVRASLSEPFSRPGKQSSLQGLGLGLYIAAEIGRAYDGELTVESTASDGTTFTLRMPAQTH
ncbi:hypothetical protein BMG03_05120 [Thioclava nitratireducens]|uniref:histidine kinase n=1 Tax=Thioclava nitratireducens TaxID=1915078 RepID=A0ABM6IF06_9RHOB|nr:HAMP domain-containing sensor histidine kinase [Thioclava nitratireducens]AQS47249.1 hypothetical protein BMG03_05120 [Thioclava nitratireducens]